LKKNTPFFILDFPTAPERYKYSRLIFIFCALFVIWTTVCEIKKGRSKNGAVQRIQQKILSMKPIWSRPTKAGTSSKYGSASTRSVQQKLVCKVDAEKLVGSFPTNSLLIFTDGSSRGNPGPSGAGAFITAPELNGVKILFPLGRATNNVGELWAIGMALEYICSNQALIELTESRPTFFLSDSLFARNAVSKGTAKHTILRPLIGRIRELSSRFVKFPPKIYWVPGHSGIAGNECADALATEASIRSESMYGGLSCTSELEFFNTFHWILS
jgi:ribonuclease HI